jgi:CHAT domain-containing protein/tetratricopeptide (TPR) repeat protein
LLPDTRCVALILAMAGWCDGAAAASPSNLEPPATSGVVVEAVDHGSALEKAGIHPGDLLLRWDQAPGSSSGSGPADAGASGTIDSPFDWYWLVTERAPRGPVDLAGQRDGRDARFTVRLGKWEGKVRPRLPAAEERRYAEAETLARQGAFEASAALLKTLSPGGSTDAERDLSCWIAYHIGRMWGDTKRWDEAQAAYRDALAKARSPRAQVVAWEGVARAYKAQQRFDQVEVAVRSELAVRQATWGESLELAKAYHDLGMVAWFQSRLDAAEEHWRRALALTERLAPESPEVSERLGNLGSMAFTRSDLPAARRLFEGALAISEKLGAETDSAAILNNLAVVSKALGDLAAAEQQLQRTLRLKERLAVPDDSLASTLVNLGDVARMRGDLAAAQSHLQRAVDLYRSAEPGGAGLAAALDNLGLLTFERGDLELAEAIYREAVSVAERATPGSPHLALLLGHWARLARDRGDLELAERSHQRARGILETLLPGSLDLASSLENLGELALDRRNVHAATRYLHNALAIAEKAAPGGEFVAASLAALGAAAAAGGRLDSAERYYRRALAILERHEPASRMAGTAWSDLGELERRRGRRDLARRYLERALAIEETLEPGSFEAAATLHGLGVLDRDVRPDLAAGYFERAIEALESQIHHLGGTQEAKASLRAEREGYYRDLVELLLWRGRGEQAFAVLERSRGRGLLALMAERDLTFPLDIPAELRQARGRIAADYDRLQEQIAALDPRKDGRRIGALASQLRDQRRQYDEVASRIRQASPRWAALQDPRPLDLASARQALDPGTVMLYYSVGQRQTDLFIVAPGSPLIVKAIPAGERALRRRVELLRALVPEARGSSGLVEARRRSLERAARDLFHLLIAPATAAIAKSERVLVVPDGSLHLLPWSALIRTTPGEPGRGWQYLAEWKPLHLALSATVYAELKRSRRPAVGDGAAILAAFGDPRFPAQLGGRELPAGTDARLRSAVQRRGLTFEALPYTRVEVQQVASLYPRSSRVYLGEEATEERAKAIGSDVRYVHFATHTTLDERFPLNSAVVLTIPEPMTGATDNGLLQAWEIFESVRLDADLVVLSGCESGLGKEQKGEGLLGLTRAFHYAGARSVAASLWQVADAATAELMVRFYRHLVAGASKDEALRQAQVELIRQSAAGRVAVARPPDRDISAPYYWAAFQISGDWE